MPENTAVITTIADIGKHEGQDVILRGWLYNMRESGKLVFPIFRDGTGLIQGVAHIFPVYYAIVLQQHAFHGFDLNTYGIGINVLIVSGYTVLLILLAAFALRRSTIAH